jgi:hypothetical protein
MLFALGFVLVPALEVSEDARTWVGAGLFGGFAALVNPALVGPAPLVAGYLVYFRERQGRSSGRLLALAGAAFLLVVLPWTIRNYERFGRVMFVRSNLAAEVYYGSVSFDTHPLGPTGEYQRLGEAEYLRQKRRALWAYVWQHPGEFLRKVWGRMGQFWVMPKISIYWLVMSVFCWLGLGLASDIGIRSLPFVFALGVFPVTYYLTLAFPKYRHPLEPVMFVLAAYAVTRWTREPGQSSLRGQSPSLFWPEGRGLKPGPSKKD